MSAYDDMRESLIASLYGALGKKYDVSPQAVIVAVDKALEGTDWENLLAGFVAADAAAQAYKLAYAGTPPSGGVSAYDATWSGAVAGQGSIVIGERENVA